MNTKTCFYIDEKLFELFFIKNDFAKDFEKFGNLNTLLCRL